MKSKNKTSNNIIRHVVCFKFKKNAKGTDIDNLIKSFFSLQHKIPDILSIEGGKNNSPENLNKGLTHCFLITFKDKKARTNYLPHPEHQAFVDSLKPILKDAFVIDYNPIS